MSRVPDNGTIESVVDAIYEEAHATGLLERSETYHHRHETESLVILTVYEWQEAQRIAKRLRPEIEGQRVVEIGGGIGLLAYCMAEYAASVVSIEVDPAWSWAFTQLLYAVKPPNLTWVFGRAESIAEWLRADVAVFCTYSAAASFRRNAAVMAPVVIDVEEKLQRRCRLRSEFQKLR